jgi:acetolactate synthase-1/3 small subunit
MKHTLAILVENKSGVLSRVASLFSRRGYNTEDSDISRITIVVHGDDHVLEQVTKQLNKLVDVIKVLDIGGEDTVERELVLIKVTASVDTRAEIIQIADIFRARIVDVASKSMIVEVTGDENKVQAIEKLLRQFGIKEMVRTGKIALIRSPKKD